MIRNICLLLALFSFGTATAQIGDNVNYKGRSEIMLSDGLFSLDQFRGFGEAREYQGLRDMPALTGAAFLSYRYFISDRVGTGIAVGVDNQWGHLSFGDPRTRGFGLPARSGNYRREVYTLAAEVSFTYSRYIRDSYYGFIGIGVTSGNINYHVYSMADPYFYYSHKPISQKFTHLNAQFTPFAYKTTGKKLSFLAEFGFGYKGMVCLGLSYRL